MMVTLGFGMSCKRWLDKADTRVAWPYPCPLQ